MTTSTIQIPKKIILTEHALKELDSETLNQSNLIVCSNNFLQREPSFEKYTQKDGNTCLQIPSQPTRQNALCILEEWSANHYSNIVAIGGGSIIDTVKLALLEIKPTKKIFIPTTAGSGSEVTDIAVYYNQKDDKTATRNSEMFSDVSICSSEFLATLPQQVFASTVADAFIHAIEALISDKGNLFTHSLASTALRSIYESILGSSQDRSILTKASVLAGIAENNAGCGLIHAMAYPIENQLKIPHGVANALCLQACVAFNVKHGVEYPTLSQGDTRSIIKDIGDLIHVLFDKEYLREMHKILHGLDIDSATQEASSIKRLLTNNPIPVSKSDIRNVYTSIIQ